MSVHPIEYRYFYPEMKRIWEEESKLQYWLKVEAALAKAHAKLGNIPEKAAEEINKKANLKYVKLERVKEIEKEIHHDLMAMVKALTEACEEDAGKYVHLGATSYDIEDTALALQFRDALKIIEDDLKELKEVLLKLAEKHKKTVCVGRTHGQHAIPTTYGMKFGVWASEVHRHLKRLDECKERLFVGKMSGAVGTMSGFGEEGFKIQEIVMEELGLKPALITTQVIQRDRIAEFLCNLSLIACTLEKIGKEIRNLQRTEILEIAEPFEKKQVGSSTMPSKRNPHKSERICGLARVVRANIMPAFEDIALEHERDLTNSSVERTIIPESCILIDYMLKQMAKILKGLEFFPENIERNLKLTRGLCLSEAVMIKLTEKGMGRQDAHELIRQLSQKAFYKKLDLREVLKADERVRKYLSKKEIDSIKEDEYIGKAVEIVEKVLKVIR